MRCPVLLVLSASCCLAAPYTYYLPQVGDGIVPNGSPETTIVLANLGKTTATVTITVTRDDATEQPLTIAGLGTNSRFTSLSPE